MPYTVQTLSDVIKIALGPYPLSVIIFFFCASALRYLLYAFRLKDANMKFDYISAAYMLESGLTFIFLIISGCESTKEYFINAPFIADMIIYSVTLDVLLNLMLFACKITKLLKKEILIFEAYIIIAKLRICNALEFPTFLFLLAAVTVIIFSILPFFSNKDNIRVKSYPDH